jgi:hypothetical protein
VIRELQGLAAIPPHKRAPGRLTRLHTRFREIADIDFFNSPLQKQIEKLLDRAAAPAESEKEPSGVNPNEYQARLWITRPRPGIDRSASAWLIRRFIDRKARFAFALENRVPSGAVPFDMFQIGFGHRGEDCTFETLQKTFRIRGETIEVIGQIVHDADLLDEKFGRKEGFGIEEVLKGWRRLDIPDKRLLDRGIQLFEALFLSLSGEEQV